MQWFEAQRLPLSVELTPVLECMRASKIPCKVSEVSGEQVIWLSEAEHLPQLQKMLRELSAGLLDVPKKSNNLNLVEAVACRQLLIGIPATLMLIFFSILGTLLVVFDSTYRWVGAFTFVDFVVKGNAYFFSDLTSVIAQHQYWRLISPAFLHFGLLHILMNSLLVYELGRRIERRRSSISLILLTVIAGLAANGLQYLMSGPSLFGGMSGVIYGYVGYIWIWQRYEPSSGFGLPLSMIGLMLVWLVLCFTGVVDWFLDGQVANGMHLGGLLGGIFVGALGVIWGKLKKLKDL